ncbi:MAG: hypothetical protein ACQESF_00785 [Nanobdellota archaeon]
MGKMSTENWAEWGSLFLLIIGFVLSLISGVAIISYLVIFLSGVFVGRIYYLRNVEIGFPFYMIVVFFLVGYLLGVYLANNGGYFFYLLFFVLGVWLGWYLHKNKYFK